MKLPATGLALVPLLTASMLCSAQDPADILRLRVLHDRTGYPVHSEVGIFKSGEEELELETDGCGNLVIRETCESSLKLEATPKESNYYKAKKRSCKERSSGEFQQVTIKVQKLMRGYRQLVHRNLLSVTIDDEEHLLWYEYEWDAARLINKKRGFCTLEVNIKRRVMDITEESWDREQIEDMHEKFPDFFKRSKKRWQVKLPCNNARELQDIIAGSYEKFKVEFEIRHSSDIKSLVSVYRGSRFEPMSCDEMISVSE